VVDVGSFWRVNLSLHDLKRIESISHNNEDLNFDGAKQSAGLGVDYFGLNGALLKKLTLTSVYSETDSHSFGAIGTITEETSAYYRSWDDILYYQGADATSITISGDARLADTLKLTPGLGHAHRSYKDINAAADDDSQSRIIGGAKLTWQPPGNQSRIDCAYAYT